MLICNAEWKISKVLKMSVFKGLKDEEVKRVEAPEYWRHHRVTTPLLKPAVKPAPISRGFADVEEVSKDCPI